MSETVYFCDENHNDTLCFVPKGKSNGMVLYVFETGFLVILFTGAYLLKKSAKTIQSGDEKKWIACRFQLTADTFCLIHNYRAAVRTGKYTRRPLPYFALSHFCKEGFQKDENVFSSKKHSCFIKFSNSSNVEYFLILCRQNLISKAENTFSGNQTVWYAFYSKFTTFIEFEKTQLFSEKPIYFFNENPIFERFEKSYYISAFYGKLGTNW